MQNNNGHNRRDRYDKADAFADIEELYTSHNHEPQFPKPREKRQTLDDPGTR